MRNLSIKLRPIEALIPYVKNSRTHSDAQVAQIAASIREFGWTNPVLVDGENGIIAGHGRVLAARKLGLTEIPCIEISDMTDAQKRAYVIADNKLAENAGWDFNILAVEFADLNKIGFDIELTGFEEDEINKIIGLPTELTEKVEKLIPIKYTRIMISVSSNVKVKDIDQFITTCIKSGCEVDYGGN